MIVVLKVIGVAFLAGLAIGTVVGTAGLLVAGALWVIHRLFGDYW